MLNVEGEQPPEKKRKGEGCEIEEQKRPEKLSAFDGSENNENVDEDGDIYMEVNQAESKMSSVEGGRPSEEEQQPEKKPQGEGQGCESEEESEESSIECYFEGSSEEEKEVVVAEEESVEEEEKEEVVVSLDEEEEEEKGQKVADDDHDFLDAYPKDRNNLFRSAMTRSCLRGFTTFDRSFRINESVVNPKRRCDRFVQCKVSDHDMFMGSPIFDLFRVELYLKNPHSKPLSGKIYGAIEIETTPDNPHPISYFFVKKENAIPFTLNPDKEYGTFSLPLSGPETRPPIVKFHWFCFKFALKIAFEGNDVVEQYKDVFEEMGCPHKNPELFDHTVEAALICLPPGSVGYKTPPGSVQMQFLPDRIEDDYVMAAFHSPYNGSWATVGVEIKEKGLSSFYGYIFARTCLFPNSRMYLLSIDKNQKRELQQPSESLHSVELTRKVVSAPTCSSLIIVAELWDQDGESIVKGKTFFPAKPNGIFGRFIGEKGVGIDVKVKWKC